jgi:hypothetical protein
MSGADGENQINRGNHLYCQIGRKGENRRNCMERVALMNFPDLENEFHLRRIIRFHYGGDGLKKSARTYKPGEPAYGLANGNPLQLPSYSKDKLGNPQ